MSTERNTERELRDLYQKRRKIDEEIEEVKKYEEDLISSGITGGTVYRPREMFK